MFKVIKPRDINVSVKPGLAGVTGRRKRPAIPNLHQHQTAAVANCSVEKSRDAFLS